MTLPKVIVEKQKIASLAKMEPDSFDVSDGYHTFDELYRHRCLLYLAFLYHHMDSASCWRARLHNDGSSITGWFVVGTLVGMPHSKQITYHLPNSMWELCNFLPTYPAAPIVFDGHTSLDVCDRIEAWLKTVSPPF